MREVVKGVDTYDDVEVVIGEREGRFIGVDEGDIGGGLVGLLRPGGDFNAVDMGNVVVGEERVHDETVSTTNVEEIG